MANVYKTENSGKNGFGRTVQRTVIKPALKRHEFILWNVANYKINNDMMTSVSS